MDDNEYDCINKKLDKIISELENQKKDKDEEIDFRFLAKLEIVNFGILFSILTISLSLFLSNIDNFQSLHLFFRIIFVVFICSIIYLILLEILIIYDEDNLLDRFRFFNKVITMAIFVIVISLYIYVLIIYYNLEAEGLDDFRQTISFYFFFIIVVIIIGIISHLFQLWLDKKFENKFKIIYKRYLKMREEERIKKEKKRKKLKSG